MAKWLTLLPKPLFHLFGSCSSPAKCNFHLFFIKNNWNKKLLLVGIELGWWAWKEIQGLSKIHSTKLSLMSKSVSVRLYNRKNFTKPITAPNFRFGFGFRTENFGFWKITENSVNHISVRSVFLRFSVISVKIFSPTIWDRMFGLRLQIGNQRSLLWF